VRFVSFNVNGIRARQHQLSAIVEKYQPDVLALQETKVVDEDFPTESMRDLGYQHVVCHGQKGHYGVALATRQPMDSVQVGIPWQPDGQQRRFVSARCQIEGRSVRLINAYFPQGGSRDHPTKFPDKARFYADLLRYLNEQCDPDELVLVAGDMNVAPSDADIGIGPDNVKRWLRTGKSGFLPEERAWLQSLVDWGLLDCYRQSEPDKQPRYSWFDYRSRGFEREPKRGLRIDLILASRTAFERLDDSGIDYDIRAGARPSDHCPVWAEFSL